MNTQFPEGTIAMANDLNPSNLLNPVMLWTDLGMRALEATLSSSQNIGEGLDRLARAGASAEVVKQAEEPAPAKVEQSSTTAASSGLALAAQMQRATFELMTQAWRQWMSMLGTLATMGAGGNFADMTTRKNPLMNSMRQGLEWGGTGNGGVAQRRSSSVSRQQGSRNASLSEAMEHGFAKSEPKRRTRTGRAKSKSRSRNS
jgi:hypothetical protein